MGSVHKNYKIRRLTTNNTTGDSYGINIPTQTAQKYADTYFSIKPAEITEIKTEIILKINDTFSKLATQLSNDNYPTIKKNWYDLRDQINSMQNPFTNSLLLSSGCKVNNKG